jgi:hypothetical protein
MASISGVSFPVVGNTVAGLLDGILTAQLRKRQFQLEDAAEARKERMFSLQEQAALDAQRQRDEARFPPPPTTRGIGQAVEQTLQQKFAQADQGVLEREAALQQQAAKEAASNRRFQEDVILTGIRGAERRKTKQVPGAGTVKPEVPKTPLEQEMEAAKTTGTFARDIRKSGSLPGDPTLTPAVLDARFGEDFLNTAVAKAISENTPGGVTAVVRDSMATHWATAVVDQAVEGDYLQGLDPSLVTEDEAEPMSDSVRKSLAPDTKTPVVTANDVRRAYPDFANIPEGLGATFDLEELAFVFVVNGGDEQDFRDFVKDTLLGRIDPEQHRQRDETVNLERSIGVSNPIVGPASLRGFR